MAHWLHTKTFEGAKGEEAEGNAPCEKRKGSVVGQQKSVIITGGAGASAGGTGRYIANKLADKGYAVTIWDVQDENGLGVVDQIRNKGGWATYIHCDIRDEEQVREAVEKTYDQTHSIDALVNNAFWHAEQQPPLHTITLDEWDRHININLRSHFIVSKYVIPHLLEHPQSAIVNISSTASRRGEDGYAAYAAAKAGLESLTRSIAAQYGRNGLRCNCVVPGLVINTQMEAMLPVLKSVKEGFDLLDAHALLPQGHGCGTHVADAVEFLLSDASAWMTGECLVLDGGAISHNPAWNDLRTK